LLTSAVRNSVFDIRYSASDPANQFSLTHMPYACGGDGKSDSLPAEEHFSAGFSE
jgi:hypothetical protein